MSGGSKTQTTVQNNEPWSGAQPLLQSTMDQAGQLQKGGIGQQVYTGSTVIPYANQTMQGMGSLQSLAQGQMGANGLAGNMANTIAAGGFNTQQQGALGQLNPFAQGAGNVQTGMISQLGGQATMPSYSEQNLSGIAGGDMLNRTDPNFERVLNRATENAANQVNMMSSGAGRYGSGTHQGVLAREVGDLQANARLGQYNTERANQMQANQLLDQQRLSGLGLGLNAAGTVAGLQGQNADRQIGAATQAFNAGQQGFNNLPTAYQNAQMPAQTLMDIGSMYEDLAGRQKNDELRIFNESQNAPWEQLARANAIAGGAGQFGSSTNTAQVPGQNPFLSALGYGSSIAGLLGSF